MSTIKSKVYVSGFGAGTAHWSSDVSRTTLCGRRSQGLHIAPDGARMCRTCARRMSVIVDGALAVAVEQYGAWRLAQFEAETQQVHDELIAALPQAHTRSFSSNRAETVICGKAWHNGWRWLHCDVKVEAARAIAMDEDQHEGPCYSKAWCEWGPSTHPAMQHKTDTCGVAFKTPKGFRVLCDVQVTGVRHEGPHYSVLFRTWEQGYEHPMELELMSAKQARDIIIYLANRAFDFGGRDNLSATELRFVDEYFAS